jgi:hypothetical protein
MNETHQYRRNGPSARRAAMKEQFARAYALHLRPLCLCCSSGVPMYVPRTGDRHILKRMPETGPQHDPSSDSYEAPYELSGFGMSRGAQSQRMRTYLTDEKRLAAPNWNSSDCSAVTLVSCKHPQIVHNAAA